MSWYNSGMSSIAEIDRFDLNPEVREWALKLLDKSKHDEIKIQALTLELAYYKRIRFANKSEQFSPEQRELFQESWTSDLSAIEAELPSTDKTEPKPRSRAGRQPLPDHLPRIEHRHEPESCQCGECGNALVKIGEDARRKFFDLHAANGSPIAADALSRIAKLYAIEEQVRGKAPEEREALRQEKAVPLLEELNAWLLKTRQSVAHGSGTANAIDYSLKRWEALDRYAKSGNLPIDNNPVENSIRPIAIGKKNWLFAGSERAGRRAAAIQTLIGTAKLNGLDPHAWLQDTLEKLPAWPNSRIDELLPFPNIA